MTITTIAIERTIIDDTKKLGRYPSVADTNILYIISVISRDTAAPTNKIDSKYLLKKYDLFSINKMFQLLQILLL